MKILTANQIRELDQQTMLREPIASIDLMERASWVFTQWLVEHILKRKQPIAVFCGPGNNGGDGLAIARLLAQRHFHPQVVVCQISERLSENCKINLDRLTAENQRRPLVLAQGDPMPHIPDDGIIVDAILGSGLSRPITGYWAELLRHLNKSQSRRIAVDMSTGLFADEPTSSVCFHAHDTFSFEMPKLAFFIPENAHRVGRWTYRSIHLDKTVWDGMESHINMAEESDAAKLLKERGVFGHKGTFGHALLIAGRRGTTGAAIMAAHAALRAGSGLVTLHVPSAERQAVHSQLPEVMVSADHHEICFSGIMNTLPGKFQAIGIGCGLGTNPVSRNGFRELLDQTSAPMVIDADALNMMAEEPGLLKLLPTNSILTPHPGEFRRLFQPQAKNGFEMLNELRELARRLGVFIILKGAYTTVGCPDGRLWINSTGNPGMATAGSGDVLTGILTGLLAQGYSPKDAAILGVYLHGLAGDLAVQDNQSEESLLAGDLIKHLGMAYKKLWKCKNALSY